MSTTGIVNGTNFLVYVDGTAIGCSTSASLSLSHATRSTSCKDSEWEARLEGRLDWSLDCEAYFAYDAAYGYTQLYDTMVARTLVQVRFSTETSGDRFWFGEAYITDLPIDAPDQDSSTFSISFEAAGPLETAEQT